MPMKRNRTTSKSQDNAENTSFQRNKSDDDNSKLKSIDTDAGSQYEQRDKVSSLRLSSRSKKKLNRLKSSAVIPKPKRTSLQSMQSFKSLAERDSLASGINELEHRQILMLKKDVDENEDIDFDEIRRKMLEEFVHDEDQTESESSAEGEVTKKEKDRIEQLRKSFTKTERELQRVSSPQAFDFFEILGEIPSLDDISLDASIVSEEELLPIAGSAKVSVDVGTFVDPLTGKEIDSSSSETRHVPLESQMSIHSVELDHEEEDLLGEMRIDEDEDLSKTDEKDEKDGETVKDFDAVTFGNWFSPPAKTASITEEFTQAVHDEYMRKVNLYIHEFLNELLTHVVRASEFADPSRIILKALDKIKLMDDIDAKLKKLEMERKTNFHLNKLVVETFRRKGDFRPLRPDNPEQVAQLTDMHAELHDRLYDVLHREEELKNVSFVRLSELKVEAEAAETIANESTKNFEKTVKNALCKERFQSLNDLVSRSFKQMSKTFDEISSQRTQLVQKLHTLGRLKEKEDELEDLGHGLKIHNFELLQAEATNVGRKAADREQDLNHLHIRRNKNLHMLTHIKEALSMVDCAVTVKESVLIDLKEEKKVARDELNVQKRIRTRLRDEIKGLQTQSGLAGNNALLLDYDRTEENLKELRDRISKMRQKHEQLEARFSRLEDKCQRGSSI